MRKSRFTESQIVAILKEGEAGVPVAESAPEARHQPADLFQLEVEVRRRQCPRAAAAQGARGGEREAEADVRGARARERRDQRRPRPKVVTPSAKRQAIAILHDAHGLSVQRSCEVVRLSRAAYYRPPAEGARLERDRPVIDALQAVVSENTRWGFWKCFDRLRLDGQWWNHKRVHRVYCALRLNIPRRTRRRIPRRVRQPLVAAQSLNTTWAIDFMVDTLYDGRRFRTLNIIDESNREGLAIEIGTTLAEPSRDRRP